jgi:hypothetical protein
VANPTTNYGFVLPSPTDLVTDLPADFDVALQGVDTRLKALQPGTTLGDLAYSSATANTNTRLGIGTNGQVLGVVGGVPAWTSTGASGKLLQLVSAATTTQTAISSSTYTDSTITATITPSSATSNVLVIVSGTIRTLRTSANQTLAGKTRLLRGASHVVEERLNNIQMQVEVATSTNEISMQVPFTFMSLDNPATTSATTYKIQGALASASGTLSFQHDSTTATIILMEIGA